MDAAFWRSRWTKNQIGFHQPDVHPYLQHCWPRLGLADEAGVLVPLCGKSLDLLWLHQQGHHVVGIEWIEAAVHAFFRENDLPPTPDTFRGFSRWTYQRLSLLCGDIFDLQPRDVANIGAIYDRGALVALPAEIRKRYVAHLKTLFPTPPSILLVTLTYPAHEMDGPPFSISAAEVETLYTGRQVDRLVQTNILGERPKFKAKGVSALYESVYHIRGEQSG